MIALTIFCWVVTALFSVWSIHAQALTKAQDYLVGEALGEQQMEAQLALGWTAKTTPMQTFVVTHIVENAYSDMTYYYNITAQEETVSGANDMKLVSVQVYFYDMAGVQRIIKFDTVLSWQG